jgi:hypothetical protein
VRVAAGVLAWVACLLLVASFASAGTFTALTCHDASGDGVGTRGWSVGAATGGYIVFGAGCADEGQGSFGLTMGPDPSAEYFNGDGSSMTYFVPAGLAIVAYSLQLRAFGGPCVVQSGQCANGFGEVFVDHTGQSDPNYDYRNLGYGAVAATVGASELSGVNSVSVGVGCDPGQNLAYPCSGAADPEAQALVSGGAFTILDSTIPSVTNVSGSLLAGGALTGTETINFTAADSGGGVYGATVLIDGRQVIREVPDTNDGLCVNLAPPSSATMVFAAPQPCRSVENISIPLDTTQLANGQHHLQVVVGDAAGDEATAYDDTISIANPGSPAGSPIGPGSPAALRGPANGMNASDQAKLTARWASTTKALRTVRYGQADRVTGRLTTQGGQAISGAELDVDQTPADNRVPTTHIIAEARTGSMGQWTLTLPRGISSSTVRVAYRSHQNDTIPVATAVLDLRVHAGIVLHITPRSTSVGRRILFSGVLHGTPIPPAGKQLVLEARSGGEWVQFDTIRTAADGRYHASYRFKFPGPVAYQFRVLSRYEADFPFQDGTSNAVDVHEH